MQTPPSTGPRLAGGPLALLALGAAALAAVAGYDIALSGRSLLAESPPELTLTQLALCGAVALGLLALLAGALALRPPRAAAPAPLWPGSAQPWLIACLAIAAGALALFLAAPATFDALAIEDGPIETVEALLLFIAAGVCAARLARSWGRPEISRADRATLLALAVALFVMGGEEISWFQRILSIQSGTFFQTYNSQGEINLHNLATGKIQAAYYFGSFVFLVVLPLVGMLGLVPERMAYLRRYWPGPAVLIAGALACGFNQSYHWNTLLTKVQWVGALLTLLTALWASRRPAERATLAAAALLVVALHVSFLLLSGALPREWSPSEYRELLMPIGYLWYSTQISRRLGAAAA